MAELAEHQLQPADPSAVLAADRHVQQRERGFHVVEWEVYGTVGGGRSGVGDGGSELVLGRVLQGNRERSGTDGRADE